MSSLSDTKTTNIMMDWSPLYPIPPHWLLSNQTSDWSGEPKPHNHTTHPVKFRLIDWDLSKQYDLSKGSPLQNPGYGGDQSVPEFKRNEPCNPFAVDVYCLGNFIRKSFIVVSGRVLGYPR